MVPVTGLEYTMEHPAETPGGNSPPDCCIYMGSSLSPGYQKREPPVGVLFFGTGVHNGFALLAGTHSDFEGNRAGNPCCLLACGLPALWFYIKFGSFCSLSDLPIAAH